MLVRHRTYTPTFDRSIDRAFEQLTNSFFDTRRTTAPQIDGAWVDNEYVLTVDLPGIAAESVAVDVTGTTLSLRAETDSLTWERSLRLGGKLDFLLGVQNDAVVMHEEGRTAAEITRQLKLEKPAVRLVSRGDLSARNLVEALLRDAGVDNDG